ncbi:ATP-binding protein [Streptomyces sp. NPDC006703]
MFAAHQFDATPISVAESRAFLQRCLTRWRLNTLGQTFTDDARLIVSELVTNAALHALKPLQPNPRQRLWLALHMQPNALICAVSDPSPAPPRMPAPAPWADAGRGLQLVAALSTAWGWTPTPPPGKTVWARLALTYH